MNKNKQSKILKALWFIRKARFEFMSKTTLDAASKNTELFELYDKIENYLLKNLQKSAGF